MNLSKKISILFLISAFFVVQLSVFAQTKSAAEFNKITISKEDDKLLEDVSKRAFMYLWEQSDEKTGLTLDRALTTGKAHPETHHSYQIASAAATGFALTGLCIAAERDWISPKKARERAKNTLDFFANKVFHRNGWFYHWMDQKTGARRWNSEISSIDTALFLGGALTVRQCFSDDKEIVDLATKIYNRVDFPWMLNGDKYLFSHGWKPESGFIKWRWNDYSENASLYLLGIGSPTNPIPWQSWYAFKRDWVNYNGIKYLSAKAPIFIHQYSHAWFDFRNKRERQKGFNVDYYENSVNATKAHRACNISLSGKFPGYSENVWGISAMDSKRGYVVWDCPPASADIDGTVAPYVSAASLMFAPDVALPAVKEIKAKYGDRIYGRYGFADAFNPNTDWVASDAIGIDMGVMVLGIENFRTGNVWKWFMANPEPQNALKLAKIQ